MQRLPSEATTGAFAGLNCRRIEVRGVAALIVGRTEAREANSVVQREVRTDAPFILRVGFKDMLANLGVEIVGGLAVVVGHSIAGNSPTRSDMSSPLKEKSAGVRAARVFVLLVSMELRAELHGVLAPDLRQVIEDAVVVVVVLVDPKARKSREVAEADVRECGSECWDRAELRRGIDGGNIRRSCVRQRVAAHSY